jgi:hypothetical protein
MLTPGVALDVCCWHFGHFFEPCRPAHCSIWQAGHYSTAPRFHKLPHTCSPPLLTRYPVGAFSAAVKVQDWFDFAGDDNQNQHYTRIRILDLREGMAVKLADPVQQRYWAQQVGWPCHHVHLPGCQPICMCASTPRHLEAQLLCFMLVALSAAHQLWRHCGPEQPGSWHGACLLPL